MCDSAAPGTRTGSARDIVSPSAPDRPRTRERARAVSSRRERPHSPLRSHMAITGKIGPGPVWVHIAVPVLFLICSVGIVAMYADDIRVSRLRRHGLEPPDDPDLGRPSP
jgi:hypothetical protein